jgi:hypothetical protein
MGSPAGVSARCVWWFIELGVARGQRSTTLGIDDRDRSVVHAFGRAAAADHGKRPREVTRRELLQAP